jgi:hypothetical protein
MGFEKRILDDISPILETGDHAEFYNGTLFLENVSGETGKRVYNRLVKRLGKENIIFSTIGDGFAVDFV